jgi:hypothetical protein
MSTATFCLKISHGSFRVADDLHFRFQLEPALTKRGLLIFAINASTSSAVAFESFTIKLPWISKPWRRDSRAFQPQFVNELPSGSWSGIFEDTSGARLLRLCSLPLLR